MAQGETLMHTQIAIIIAILTLFGTYAIVDMKTKDISTQVADRILEMEYSKV